MNIEMSRKALGNYLKNLRKSKKVSAAKLGKEIGKSQGYISGVENGTRSFPTNDFIKNYVDTLSNNSIEFNLRIDEINSLPNVTVDIDKQKVDENYSDTSSDEITDIFKVSAPNVMEHYTSDGIAHDEYYDFPINDLSYHLSDLNNCKYFRKIELDDNDKEYLNNFINSYLVNKMNIQINAMRKRLANGEIAQETHDDYIEGTQNLINKLLDPNELKY